MIWTQGLARSFAGKDAVTGLDLDIKPGEVFGFLGPNGAGKSTTTRMLTTLLTPDKGSARVAGYDPVSEARMVRQRIGYVPDELPVYGQRTATEFLALFARMHAIPARLAPSQIRRLLDHVGLADVKGKPVGRFSKGMKQRLGLARALLGKPEVLFLDEPASGLDPVGRREIRDLIKGVARGGATVFLCSHDLAEVQDVCQRVAIIRSGRIVRELSLKGNAVKVLRLEVEGDVSSLRTALATLPNLARAQRRGNHLRLEFGGPIDQREVARRIQQAGVLLLGIQEEGVDLERVYREAMEARA